MIRRSASVIVCDDILIGLTGKVHLQGVYPSDITIPGDVLSINQLVFYFTAETPKDKPFKKLVLKVTPPGAGPTQIEIPLSSVSQVSNPERPKMILRAPLLMQQVLLRPGKIEAKVITESEELDAGGIWISSTSPPTAPS
jgi:hypothetical protein